MRFLRLAVATVFSLSLASPGTAAETESAPAWPATRVGDVAKGWVTAFNGGEKAMREFLSARMSAKALADRPVPDRIERYLELRESYGRLQLERVVKSEPYELTVKLLDADARPKEFIFKSEEKSPWKLASVSIKQPGFHHGHGSGHGHGH